MILDSASARRAHPRPGSSAAPARVFVFGLFLASSLWLASPGRAQPDMTRTTFSGTYVPIATAMGAAVLSYPAGDDEIRSIPLPFAFSFGGTGWTTADFLAISTNGFAFLYHSAAAFHDSYALSALHADGNPYQALAPWWSNLSLDPVGVNPAGQVLTQTLGAPGARELVVQWTDVSSHNTALGGQPWRLNFQLHLKETDGSVEFHYAPPVGGQGHPAEAAGIGVKNSLNPLNPTIDGPTGSLFIHNTMLNAKRWPTRHLRFAPGAPTPVLAGTYTVGASGIYTTIGEAFAELNHRGISGAVTLELTDGLYGETTELFPLLLGPVAGASAARPILIRPATGRATLRSAGATAGSATGIGLSSEPILGLIGADFVTVRDLDLALSPGSWVDRGLYVANVYPNDGAQDNTFDGLSCVLLRDNPASLGVCQANTTTPTGAAGWNARNRYLNLRVENASSGIHLDGPGLDCEVGACVIGGPAVGDIIAFAAPGAFGIRATQQTGMRIHDCEVRNLVGVSSVGATGIWLDNSGTTFTNVGVSSIYNNRVHDLDRVSGNSAASSVRGIRVNLPSNGANESRVYNNMVWGLNSSQGGGGLGLSGISVQDAGGGSGVLHNVDFNSVRIEPTGIGCSNAAFEANVTGSLVLRVRNNILANFTPAQSGAARHYAWASVGSASLGSLGSTSNYNVLYVANATNGAVGLALTDRVSINDWRALPGSPDLYSLARDPAFVSPVDLHIDPVLISAAEGMGSLYSGAMPWITDDQDGDPRNATSPDIGADEGNFTPWHALDMAAQAILQPTPGSMVAVGATLTPQARWQNLGTLLAGATPVRFRIVGPDSNPSEVYNAAGVTPPLGADQLATITFPSVSLTMPGSYQLIARAELPGDEVPANDEVIASLLMVGPLAGVIPVGSAQPPPFNTLTNAVAGLDLAGMAGSVVFELTDPLYASPTEQFPLTIRPWAGAGPTKSLTIRPAPGTHPTLQGPGSGGVALIQLAGADFVTIDGSNSGGSSRDLTLIGPDQDPNLAVCLWLASQGNGLGCHDVVVRNCRLSCPQEPVGVTRNTMGILVAGSAFGIGSVGADNDDNRFLNNEITQVTWGIVVHGSPGNPNDRQEITGNRIGSSAERTRIGKAGIVIRGQNQAQVRGNTIEAVGLTDWSGALGVDRCGIALGAVTWPASLTTTCTGCVVAGNRIHDVQEQGTRSAIGILNACNTSSGGNVIANNMIDDIRANGAGGHQAIGIGFDGDAASDVIAFNSIRMTGDMDPPGSPAATESGCGIRVRSITATNLRVLNNILSMDVHSNTSTLLHFAISFATNFFMVGNREINGNGYDLASGNPQLRLGGIGAGSPYNGVYADLASWRTVFSIPQDGASLQAAAPFLSNTDLHLDPGAATPLRAAALALAAVSDDFDGDPRDSLPDIGADEVGAAMLQVGDAQFVEGNSGLTPFSFVVRLSPASPDTVAVRFELLAGTAGPDSDYVALAGPGTVTFAPGDTSATIVVQVLGDPLPEPDETFQVRLSEPQGATLTDSLATGTILNDDTTSGVDEAGPPQLDRLLNASPNPFRGQTLLTVELVRAGDALLQVFDVRGALVRTLIRGPLAPGRRSVAWDGRNDAGTRVPSGFYAVRFQTGADVQVRGLRLIR